MSPVRPPSVATALDAEARAAFRADYEATGLRYLRTLGIAVLFASVALLIALIAGIQSRPSAVLVLTTGAAALLAGGWLTIAHQGRPLPHAAAGGTLFLAALLLTGALLVCDPFGFDGRPIFLASLLTLIAFFAFGATGIPPGYTAFTVMAGALALIAAHETLVPQFDLSAADIGLISALSLVLCTGGYFKQRATEAHERQIFAGSRALVEAQARAELLAQQAQHEAAERARFLAAVSHDVRQPISALNLRASLLRERLATADGTTRQHFEDLAQGIGTLGRTLTATLGLSRLQARDEPWPLEPVNLAELLREAHATFRPLAAGLGVELALRLPPDADTCWTLTQREQLAMVVNNLLANALQFQRTPAEEPAPRRRFVHIALTRRGAQLRLRITDNGVGIGTADQVRIFEPYFQVGNPERNQARGVGLGLANVRAALRWLPGHALRMHSTPACGSRFTVTLPAEAPPWFARRQIEMLPVHVRLEGAYVLVLEDDAALRESLLQRLQAWGAVTLGAASLVEIEETLLEEDRLPDVLITDYQLAGAHNGLFAITRLRQRLAAPLPAILISGHEELGDQARNVDLPPDTVFLAKPINSDELGHTLTRLVLAAADLEAV